MVGGYGCRSLYTAVELGGRLEVCFCWGIGCRRIVLDYGMLERALLCKKFGIDAFLSHSNTMAIPEHQDCS